MGVVFKKYLNGSVIYGCKNCKTHLALWDDIMSKNFRGRLGEAYLFKNVVNVDRSEIEERKMMTGVYSVQDIQCKECAQNVGWTYVKAYDINEQYKEGRFILEVKAFVQVQ